MVICLTRASSDQPGIALFAVSRRPANQESSGEFVAADGKRKVSEQPEDRHEGYQQDPENALPGREWLRHDAGERAEQNRHPETRGHQPDLGGKLALLEGESAE